MKTTANFWSSPAGVGLRWALFLPAAAAGLVAATVVGTLLYRFSAWLGGMNPDAPWVTIMVAVLGALACVHAGAYTAPARGRRATSVILATLLVLLSVIAILITFKTNSWANLLALTASAIAAIVASISIHNEHVDLS